MFVLIFLQSSLVTSKQNNGIEIEKTPSFIPEEEDSRSQFDFIEKFFSANNKKEVKFRFICSVGSLLNIKRNFFSASSLREQITFDEIISALYL